MTSDTTWLLATMSRIARSVPKALYHVTATGLAILVATSCAAQVTSDTTATPTSFAPETVAPAIDPTTSTKQVVTTTLQPSSESTTNLNIAGGNDPEDFLMPNVVCMNLQEAQDEIQDHGVVYSRSEDASGRNRSQLIDSNWIVVRQSPRPGSPITEGTPLLSAVKMGESTDGVC